MNIDYLKSFYWVAKYNSISKASQKLHISQPGLSMQLKNLEEELGHTLLIRSNKGVLLTSVGEVVYEYAKSIFTLEENMYCSIEDLAKKENKLSIACCKNFGSYHLVSKLYQFKEVYSDADIRVDIYSTPEVIESVLSYDSNIGIIIAPSGVELLEEKKFCDDELVFFTHASYPKDSMCKDEFLKAPLVIRDKCCTDYRLIKEFTKANGYDLKELNVLLYSNCIDIIKSFIFNNRSFSFLPRSCIQFEVDRNLFKEVKLDDFDSKSSLKYSYAFIKRKQHELNHYEKSFKDFLLSVSEEKVFAI